MDLFNHTKIQVKLFVTYLILAAPPLCILGFFSYYSASKALTNQISQSLSSVVEKSVNQMDAFLDVCIRDTQELSLKPVTPMAFYLRMYTRSLTSVKNEYLTFMKDRPYISQIRLLTVDGKEIVSTLEEGKNKTKDESRAGWFNGALNSNKIYISDMFLDEDTNQPVLTMAKVLTTAEGKKLGVLALDIKGAAVTSFIDEIKVGKTGYGYLLDKNALTISHPQKKNIMKVNVLRLPDKGLREVGRHMINLEKGQGHYEYEGVSKQVFYAPYKKFGWSAAVTIPDNELFEETYRLRGIIIIVCILSIMVAIILSIFMSLSITRPIEKLKDGIAMIGKGNLDYRVGTNSEDEIGHLSRAFDAMTENLRKVTASRDQLDKEISQREKAQQELKQAFNDLKETQKRLVQSEKMAGIGQLAAGVAHEINNPTCFVMANLEFLQNNMGNLLKAIADLEELVRSHMPPDEAVAKTVQDRLKVINYAHNIDFLKKDLPSVIKQSMDGTDRIRTIVANLRSFAHPAVEGYGPVNINEEIDKALSLVQNELKYKCEIVKEYGALPAVSANSQQMEQVFVNILVNASHAIKHNSGVITIKTYTWDKFVCTEVSDNGEGIPPENISKIFDPFFTTKNVGEGTGLGLSIVYGIIKEHQGTIEAQSEVGKGTRFIIKIPSVIQ